MRATNLHKEQRKPLGRPRRTDRDLSLPGHSELGHVERLGFTPPSPLLDHPRWSAEMVHFSVSSHLSVLNFLSLKTKDLGTPIFHNEEVTWCWFYTSTKTQQATYVE